jgi:hypothetical protein
VLATPYVVGLTSASFPAPPSLPLVTHLQLMTFLLVNAACSLSDCYGRRPFMYVFTSSTPSPHKTSSTPACPLADLPLHLLLPRALANTGLGAGQVIAALAGRAEWLLLGAFVDGCTSYR